jgi:septal ring factor EnvC (AmiA/AmiB activator)
LNQGINKWEREMAKVKQTIEIPDKEVKKYAGDQIRKLEKEVARLNGFVTRRNNQIEKLKGQIEVLKQENQGMRTDKRLSKMSDALSTLMELAQEAGSNENYRDCCWCGCSFYDPVREYGRCPICGEVV